MKRLVIVLGRGETILFTTYRQRIGRYFQQHRLISIFVGHVLVMTVLLGGLLSSTLGKSLIGAFAQTYCPSGDQADVVIFGDTLSNIATSHGTTWQVLAQHNKIANPNLIYPGQVICIPGANSAVSGTNTQSAPASESSSPASIINQIFGVDASGAMQVAKCESGLNPNAANPTSIGGSNARGLFQILYPSTWNTTSQAAKSPYDALANAQAAHDIFVRDGHSWREWTCQP